MLIQNQLDGSQSSKVCKYGSAHLICVYNVCIKDKALSNSLISNNRLSRGKNMVPA